MLFFLPIDLPCLLLSDIRIDCSRNNSIANHAADISLVIFHEVCIIRKAFSKMAVKLSRSRRLRLPEFLDIRHVQVVGLSVLRSGHLHPPGGTPANHFC